MAMEVIFWARSNCSNGSVGITSVLKQSKNITPQTFKSLSMHPLLTYVPSPCAYLAQNRYFEDEAFIGYLKYLQYWQRPEYIKFIMYPHCLFFLELLQNPAFRNAMAHPANKEVAHRQQFYFWKNYRNNRLKHILPRPLPEPATAPPTSAPPALLPTSVAPPAAPPPAPSPVTAAALSPMQYAIPPGSGLAKTDPRNASVDRRKRKYFLSSFTFLFCEKVVKVIIMELGYLQRVRKEVNPVYCCCTRLQEWSLAILYSDLVHHRLLNLVSDAIINYAPYCYEFFIAPKQNKNTNISSSYGSSLISLLLLWPVVSAEGNSGSCGRARNLTFENVMPSKPPFLFSRAGETHANK
ncbi:Mediator of RNA polymerase II transcription subunit 31 [Capsicum annuum]|uniref:Mediator of RNA polymerase II transcription subunit 31 n=1 Tax=Capsicum annuum TaxID=4072 RepID=A0A2G2YAQ5_CAPAN|nr:Mediator of RNA polymerase II transcription subunit 31 [Capsicum annuum]